MEIPQQYNFALEYTPSDFFYLTNATDVPEQFVCQDLYANPPVCAGATDPTVLTQCYQAELCKNQILVNKMYEKRNKHSEMETKLLDFKSKYKFEIITSINLGIGIIGAIAYIYYNNSE